MVSRGQNEGYRVLDDFICQALHSPDSPRASATNQGQNEGMRVIGEVVLAGPQEASEKVKADRHGSRHHEPQMTRAQRAQQLWCLLALAAMNRQILTYDIVARLTGVVRPSIGDFLRPIQQYCTEEGLPPLTSLVVSEKDGLPGEGFIAAADVPVAQVRVFQHSWLETTTPKVQQLEAAYSRAPEARMSLRPSSEPASSETP